MTFFTFFSIFPFLHAHTCACSISNYLLTIIITNSHLMQANREKNNKSSIDFNKFHEQQPDPQQNRIYVCRSVIGESMNDHPRPPTPTESKFYKNRIFHSSQKYQVPQCEDPRLERQDRSYHDFFKSRQKFTKPYGENTKYTDLLNKNQMLLRRGQFDIPLALQRPPKLEKKQKNNRIFRYLRHTAKPNPQDERTIEVESSYKQNYFDKTVSTQYTVFKKLLGKERSQKSEWVGLNNSMNRILAAESIDIFTRPQTRHHTIDV